MMLRKWILCLLLSIFFCSITKAIPQFAFRISFTDKAGSPTLSNPLAFLSQRALDRRFQQGIAVNTTDQPVSPLYLDTVLSITQAKLHVTSRWLNSCVILVTDTTNISQLRLRPWVTEIAYVAYYTNGLHKPANKFEKETAFHSPFLKTTGNPAYYGPAWSQTNMLHGDCLHDAGWKGQGKLIAILDDGFLNVNTAPGFDSLYQSGRIIDKNNFVLADSFVYGYNSHGTEVLSTMAAYLPNTYVGAAPLAQYALYITEDQGSEQPIEMDNMIAGFERADSVGADVITSSLGYNIFFGPVPYTLSSSELDGKTTPAARAANIASMKGLLVVITAGNEGSGGLLTPGDADSVITVGSVDVNKVPAGSSGYGPNSAAQIKPDVCAQGQPGWAMNGNFSSFAINGTSIATPQIAGFAACLWQATTGKTSYQVKDAIRKSGHLYTNPSMPQLGYGVPDYCAALVSLDIEDVASKNNAIHIHPNPVKNEITVSIKSAVKQPLQVQVLDVTGKLMFSSVHTIHAGNNEIIVNAVSNLSPGIYLCKITAATGVKTVKFIKE